MDRALIELPVSHTIPVSWIKEHGCPPIQWRTVKEILPAGSATTADMKALEAAARSYKPVQQIVKKQRDQGTWGSNLLGTGPDKALGIKGPGTIARYRQLLELGLSPSSRPFVLANRVLFRVLSRDPAPELLFEYKKEAKGDPALQDWARQLLRDGVVAALAHAGRRRDPRVRGAAKKMADRVSRFLRSDLAQDPLIKSGNKYTLHPDAHPPTLFTFTMAAYMPLFRKERGGLVERLTAFINRPGPASNYAIRVGEKTLKPTYHLLGDPIEFDSAGRPKDIPFALHWIELLARMGMLDESESAQRALINILSECDSDGVWSPKGLRSIPKSQTTLCDFAFPLEADAKEADHRKSDVTFRLALIAKLCGWDIRYS